MSEFARPVFLVSGCLDPPQTLGVHDERSESLYTQILAFILNLAQQFEPRFLVASSESSPSVPFERSPLWSLVIAVPPFTLHQRCLIELDGLKGELFVGSSTPLAQCTSSLAGRLHRVLDVSKKSKVMVLVQVRVPHIRGIANPGLLMLLQIFGAFHLLHLTLKANSRDREPQFSISFTRSTLDIHMPFHLAQGGLGHLPIP